MKKVKDISGQQFGRLTALYRLHNTKGKRAYWLCTCECGNLKIISLSDLTTSHTKSCGCLRGEIHNDSYSRLYITWRNIKQRCYNVNDKRYKDYGGRGITVCDEWYNSYLAFKEWAMNNGYKDDLTIDRVDYNGNYSPDNCKWSTVKQQNNNQRKNLYFTINNITKTLAEWCEGYRINYNKVYQRIYKLGWSIEKSLEINP